MKHQEIIWNFEKEQVYYQVSVPQDKPIVGCMVWVHGMGEHSGRYDWYINEFGKLGFASIAFDLFGHGKTTGKRGHVKSYDHLLACIDTAITEAEKLVLRHQIFLYGHSMGGNIVANYLLDRNPNLGGIILSASALKLAFEPSSLLIFIGNLTRKIMPGFTQPNGLNPNDLSRDPQVVEAYINDPLVHNRVSSELGLSLLERGKSALQRAVDFKPNVPVLVLHGAEDKIASPAGSKQFAEALQAKFILYPNLFHEIHNEPEKNQVLGDVVNWITKLLK